MSLKPISRIHLSKMNIMKGHRNRYSFKPSRGRHGIRKLRVLVFLLLIGGVAFGYKAIAQNNFAPDSESENPVRELPRNIQNVPSGPADQDSRPDVIGSEGIENDSAGDTEEVSNDSPGNTGDDEEFLLEELVQQELNRQKLESIESRSSLASSIPDIPSLLFFPRQIALIKEFELGLLTPPPDTRPPRVENPVLPPETNDAIRELYLSGILYNDEDDWIIWMNGQRITSDEKDLPDVIFELNVNKEYVELVWHDLNTNIVYPIRLRPNQRFNLDSRLFIPG